MAKRRITIERIYKGTTAQVWELWTTKDGIESWWGPEGFEVKVIALDLRPGGELRYAMTATAAPQVEFMKKHSMPLTTNARLTYTEITVEKRLAYLHVADFIPGVDPYDVATQVDLRTSEKGVHLTLTFDAMHDDVWTQRASAGWESELDKLHKVIER